jgi:hypothetical protein
MSAARMRTTRQKQREQDSAKKKHSHGSIMPQEPSDRKVFPEFCCRLKWCQRRELNPRPKAYESSALPLSYSGDARKYLGENRVIVKWFAAIWQLLPH